MMTNKRNGTIELLRFVFCIVVLLFHITNDIHSVGREGGVFRLGGLSVEFFFIVSGYYMACSIAKQNETHSLSVWNYIKNKISPILPYHLVFNTVVILGSIFINHRGFEEVLNKMTSYFFLPVVGFNDFEWALGAEWYIGCMLFVMAILYPIMQKNNKAICEYVAPVLAFILLGFLASHNESIINADRLLRAFAGILLGVTAFRATKQLNNIEFSGIKSVVAVYPAVVIILLLVYMNMKFDDSIQPIAVLLMWSALVFVFAEKGIISRSGILNNKYIYLLGRYSLPIYLIQNITRNFSAVVLHGFDHNLYPIVSFITTIVGGVLSYYIYTAIRCTYPRQKNT